VELLLGSGSETRKLEPRALGGSEDRKVKIDAKYDSFIIYVQKTRFVNSTFEVIFS
jgi:hypothetical protein